MAEARDPEGLAAKGTAPLATRPWIVIPALVASVGFMALAGLSPPRLAILAGGGVVLAGVAAAHAFLGSRRAPQAIFVSLLVTLAVVTLTAAVSGGLASPYLPLLVGPAITTLAVHGVGRQAAIALGLTAAALVGLAFLPDAWTGPPFARRTGGLLSAWAIAVVVAALTVELATLSRGLITTTRTVRNMSEELLQDLAARRREIDSMASKVAHEIKNPLTALKSLLQLEKAQAPEERSQKRFAVMSSEVARMEAIVRDYLTFSKPLGVIALADVDLGRLADDVVAVLEGRAGDAGVSLRREGKGATIVGDERRLKEALLNLGQNAVEATPDGGTVAISVDPTGDGARLIVRDTGTGISPGIMGKLGTSFVTTRPQGTGLGVAIARNIVTQHQGTLELTNRPEGGAVATVLLPRRPKQEEGAHGQDPAG